MRVYILVATSLLLHQVKCRPSLWSRPTPISLIHDWNSSVSWGFTGSPVILSSWDNIALKSPNISQGSKLFRLILLGESHNPILVLGVLWPYTIVIRLWKSRVFVLYFTLHQLISTIQNSYLHFTMLPDNPYPSIKNIRIIGKDFPFLPHFILSSFSFVSLNLCFYTFHKVYSILQQKRFQLLLLIGLVQPSNIPGTDDHVILGGAGALALCVSSLGSTWVPTRGVKVLEVEGLSSLLLAWGPLALN